jgi:hypothetical protein
MLLIAPCSWFMLYSSVACRCRRIYFSNARSQHFPCTEEQQMSGLRCCFIDLKHLISSLLLRTVRIKLYYKCTLIWVWTSVFSSAIEKHTN